MDRDLIRAAKLGDAMAREVVMRWMLVMLEESLSWAGRDRDDLVQATLADVLAKLASHAPDHPDELRTWVLSFARMEVLTSTRDKRRARDRATRVQRHEQAHPRYRPSPTSRVGRDQRRGIMMRYVYQLPVLYRRTVLHYLNGGTHQQLAALEGISALAARQRLWKGKRLLRLMYEQAPRRTPTPFRTPAAASLKKSVGR